ncbi:MULTISPECIES: UTP--glucose-1-phosphate uridylyltransferase GalU [unclassified Candidatus Frackibacter]|uniref:UTP--glucose-1-phosphate uridylyltransferase GalU n=1 Tax=unclassified Candidatus Frackibacter TaxID=2648818 RepID=UPI00087F5AC9|nr:MULTISPECIES: UTP--glucose-1-phosphate uridylyltransferase GalU [unclassified Candidatus Frackibacter]SDC81912.1 UDP-glucose pyrophosphorylase [Candidatus Frackibacter sp. WG11]SEM96382.1 UDP-glucose pyrophosphorylase [Candidatus Frackibacter sp. WG12]SFM03991.1 UDP-glucose pyrophosphorylase [Candidatus Frackibacter sp. WG13]
MKVKKAVIPAAGLGTRFLPATKAQPKEMLPIVDKPTIQYIVEEAVEAGIEDVIIITGRHKRAIEDHFDKSFELEVTLEEQGKMERLKIVQDISNLVDVHYVRQKEPLGLGHAILCAKTFVGNEPFAVLLGDDIVKAKKPVTKQLIEAFEEKESTVIGVQRVPDKLVHNYGIVDYSNGNGDDYQVQDLVEKPALEEAPSNIAILGRYVITPAIFDILENTDPGKGDEIQLTDALKTLLGQEEVYAHVFQGRRYDIGNKLGFLEAVVEFAFDRDDIRDDFKDYLLGYLQTELKDDFYKEVASTQEIK